MIRFEDTAIYFGNFPVYYYGIILMLGVVAAAYVAEAEAKRKKMNTAFLWDSLVWMVVGGVVGARLWHVLTPPPSMGITFLDYLKRPLDIIDIRSGGLGLPGAVIGGVYALYVFSKRRNQKFIRWLDVITPGIPLGQAIGRWGNFINQELYGKPTDLPWGISIDPANRLPEYANVEYYHPIFLYEALWSLGSMFFLLWLARKHDKKLKPGDLFLTYLITYPIIRILLDFLRLDASQVGGININQTVMALILVIASVTLIRRHPRKKKEQTE